MLKPLPISPRIVEQAAKATIKNLIDAIVELVTNSDDSYRKLEGNGEKVGGEIKIYVNRKKGGICERLIVEDHAGGMSKEELKKAIEFAGETSAFYEGKSVRGFFGRGLKEAIVALGTGEIKTIKNGKLSRTKILSEKGHAKYDTKLLENVIDSSEENGTKVIIDVKNKKIKCPGIRKFKDQLSKHYALRDINSSPQRIVRLVFKELASRSKYHGAPTTEENISFFYPKGIKKVDRKISLPGYGDIIKLVVYETQDPLSSPGNNPFGLAGILIKTKGAISDNKLFKFENDPVGLYFFGEAFCEGIATRLGQGETDLVDFNRKGLAWDHEYCEALSKVVEKALEPLIEEKGKILENRPGREVEGSTTKLIKKLCSFLNEIWKEEVGIDEDKLPELPPDITTLTITPKSGRVQINKPRVLSISAPDELIKKEGKELIIQSDTDDIAPLTTKLKLERSFKYPEILWSKYFKVAGYKEGAVGIITVKLGNITKSARIRVAPPGVMGPHPPKKGGWISDIKPDRGGKTIENQRASYDYKTRTIWVNVRFPSIYRFIKDGFEGVDTPEARVLMAEIVGEVVTRVIARKRVERGEYIPTSPTAIIEAFNTKVDELQKKYLHKIQKLIFYWKF